MIKVENIETWGFEHAIRGMRLPMNSGAKSDSKWVDDPLTNLPVYQIGKNDLDLMKRLFKASLEQNHAHRKYLRQIFVSMDITAPLFWWKQMDQYRINVTTNSASTMHRIHSKPIELTDFSFEDFYIEDMGIGVRDCFINVIADCENLRQLYLNTNDKKYWRTLIQLLPESYNQKRTTTMNYENVVNMINQRSNHKLSEWREFTDILKDLPYVREIMES